MKRGVTMINFGKRLYELRKASNYTQEELASLLNVSNAAVSKWESGISYPDITLLPNIARIFKVSIDTLLGLELRNETIKELKDEALKLLNSGHFSDALYHLESALVKYPNDPELNLIMGRALLISGTNKKEKNIELVNKSLRYFDKTLYLDNEGSFKEVTIQNKSYALTILGRYEEAIELLESLNSDKYILEIANIYIKMGKVEKGMVLLQKLLSDFAFSFPILTNSLANCYEKLGRKDEAYELMKLCACFREKFTNLNNANYFDFLSSRDYLDLSLYAMKNEKIEEMYEYLEKAIEHAKKFDSNPSYDLSNVKFLYGLEGSYGNGGFKAMPYIIEKMKLEFSRFSEEERFKKLIKDTNS